MACTNCSYAHIITNMQTYVCVCVCAVYKYSCQIVRRTGAHWAYDKRAIYFGSRRRRRRLFDFLRQRNFCTLRGGVNVRALFVAIVLGINQFYEWHISYPTSFPAFLPLSSCNLQALFISCLAFYLLAQIAFDFDLPQRKSARQLVVKVS